MPQLFRQKCVDVVMMFKLVRRDNCFVLVKSRFLQNLLEQWLIVTASGLLKGPGRSTLSGCLWSVFEVPSLVLVQRRLIKANF